MEQVADIEVREAAATALMEIAQGLAYELHPRRRTALRAGLDSSLERDWGFDSLTRGTPAPRRAWLLCAPSPTAAQRG